MITSTTSGTQRAFFFDRAVVMRQMDASLRKGLAQAGAYVMQTARRSMRVVTDNPAGRIMGGTYGIAQASKPGQPPMAHAKHPWLRGHGGSRFGVFFAYDPARGSVVIGPNLIPGQRYNVPQVLERGGTAMVRNSRRRVRRVGGVGEIRVGGRPCRSTRTVIDYQGISQQVTYARLRTAGQAHRANAFNATIYGKAKWRQIHMAARPYMAAAMAKCRAKVTEIVAGIRRVYGEVA